MSAPDVEGSVYEPPPGPCEPATPEPWLETNARAWAADQGRVWVSGLENLGAGHIDGETGAITVLAERHLGVWSMAARDGHGWWTHSGFSDAAGALLFSSRGAGARALHDGLTQPGGVQVDANWVYYAEHTNSGSLRDEMRARILRVPRNGGRPQELATGLGLPTHTALVRDHVYWFDSRRGHIARVPTSGGPVEVVVRGASRIGADSDSILFTADSALQRLDVDDLTTERLATLPTGVRRIVGFEEGVLLSLWYGSGRVGNALGFVPRGEDRLIEIDPQGGYPAVGDRRIYWESPGFGTGTQKGLNRVCREYLETL